MTGPPEEAGGPGRRVMVTGLGASTPLGGDAPATWSALLAGVSGVRELTAEWAEDLPVRFGAPVAVEPSERLEGYQTRRMGRSQQLAWLAAEEAWEDAGAPEVPASRLAVSVASGGGGVSDLLDQYDVLRERGWKRVATHTLPMYMSNGAAAWLSVRYGATAEVRAPAAACSSGADALAHGQELIRSGQADVVLAGGTDAMLHPVMVAGFAAMRALSRRNDDPASACRPFDRGRDGFVLGEGAGLLVLEDAAHAARRGVRGYAELAGVGRSADAHHISNPEPTGEGAVRAMRRALADAGLGPDAVRHVNAHATGTPMGDLAEARALRELLGPRLGGASVTATKSLTGHLLGASGAVEAVVTTLALRHGLAPPTVNLTDPDPRVGEDVLDAVVRDAPASLPGGPRAALSNSFAFGGQNVSLLLRDSGAADGTGAATGA
ncbi:beta-ketoacyl-[acyl-carrier-protein] synthase family protein [Streptomyces sp. AJS327]|uniref:beta-ketoacyl-[acyl-carrier-protein] synthase family protein n=1 Tax=Streptomyces sp. AJS327 TaxID=2545265 RepID=UPI0015DFD810|nr:beta-ketoacyl-[acyl-carrier-protein] synthase family protein [Streptomyces sp. AJS327]MBA0053735.1 beta-ketoacyl-[acyl-carrier-protein] synthase family protein [Streptomyces sp. AJS327]